jgi:hypothetical protein
VRGPDYGEGEGAGVVGSGCGVVGSGAGLVALGSDDAEAEPDSLGLGVGSFEAVGEDERLLGFGDGDDVGDPLVVAEPCDGRGVPVPLVATAAGAGVPAFAVADLFGFRFFAGGVLREGVGSTSGVTAGAGAADVAVGAGAATAAGVVATGTGSGSQV